MTNFSSGRVSKGGVCQRLSIDRVVVTASALHREGIDLGVPDLAFDREAGRRPGRTREAMGHRAGNDIPGMSTGGKVRKRKRWQIGQDQLSIHPSRLLPATRADVVLLKAPKLKY